MTDNRRQMKNNLLVEVTAIKDGTSERPIPTAWRAALCRIVDAFVEGDYGLLDGLSEVEAVSSETASHVQSCVHDYGATLRPLPQESWDTSVCIWTGSHWDLLVDLYTIEEGRSDLVLGASVVDTSAGFKISVHMVYVP